MLFNDTQLVTPEPRCASCNDRPGGCYDCEQPTFAATYIADPDDTTPPPWDTPDAGRQIAIHYHRRYTSFIETYRCLDIASRARMAVCYAEYMSRQLGRTMEPYHVLAVWDKAVYGDSTLSARDR